MRGLVGFARAARWWGATLLLVAVVVAVAAGQDAETPPVTLHVYTDLLQIPVLVLNQAQQPMVGLTSKQFRLSVDTGPLFEPPYVRREGDDPIALTVLLDANVRGAAAEARAVAAVAGLVGHALTERDRVVLEAVHACGATRTEPLRVTSAAVVRRRMAAVLNARDAAPANAACEKPKPLWDMMADAVVRQGDQSGRRVLLVVSDGVDRGSRTVWRDLRRAASERSVAIFGVSFPEERTREWRKTSATRGVPEPDALMALCELTGGVLTWSSSAELEGAMQEVVRMVRERYILEFARPEHMESGAHDLDVTVAKGNAFVRPAGISFPRADAAERTATDAMPVRGTRAPEPGKRRVLNGPP